MKNQNLNSGLFGSIGENMVAFELAKRNWYIYRPYFDTRIDFIAQKFVCKKCFNDWESKNIVTCDNQTCESFGKSLNDKHYIKNRKCTDPDCGYIFDKYATNMICPLCENEMEVTETKKNNQRNFEFKCKNTECGATFNSQKRSCVKCGEKAIEYPVCSACQNPVVIMNAKCCNTNCDSHEYSIIFRTIQVKSSHEEEKGLIGFNFKVQDLIDDERHFLVVYSRTFDDDSHEELHNYWVMSVQEFKNQYVNDNASTLIYQNNRVHPPSKTSESYFHSSEYNKLIFELDDVDENDENGLRDLQDKIVEMDVFSKLNKELKGDIL